MRSSNEWEADYVYLSLSMLRVPVSEPSDIVCRSPLTKPGPWGLGWEHNTVLQRESASDAVQRFLSWTLKPPVSQWARSSQSCYGRLPLSARAIRSRSNRGCRSHT